MYKFLALLLCLITFTGTTTAQKRKASDACPGLNNKKPTGSYASLSQRSGGDKSFISPKYQHLYSRSRMPVTASAETKRSTTSESKQGKVQEDEFIPTNKRNESSRSLREEGKGKRNVTPEVKTEEPVSLASDNEHPNNPPLAEQSTKSTVANTPVDAADNGPGEPAAGVDSASRSETAGSEKAPETNTTYSKYSGEESATGIESTEKAKSGKKTGSALTPAKRSGEARKVSADKPTTKRKKICLGKKNADSCPKF